MIKQIVITALTFISLNALSQPQNSNEMVVEGVAKIKAKPDLVTFTLNVEKKDVTESSSITLLNKEIDALVKSLNEIGFDNKSIKISDYNVSGVQDEQKKKLYSATSNLKLEFGLDTKRIDAIYNTILKADLKDIDISFEVKLSDSLEKAIRIKLVQFAIEDAKSNAYNIAKTLNIKLAGIRKVQKTSQGLLETDKAVTANFTPPKLVSDREVRYTTPFDKFQVDDIELLEDITIVYEILN
jgi:uncharacterized protein